MTAMGLTACHLEASDNGDLDGMWVLATVDTLCSGGHAVVLDSCYTWAFQGKLLELRNLTGLGESESIMCRFDYTGDSLIVNPLSISESGHKDTRLKVMQDNVRIYGLRRLGEHYKISRLSSKNLILESSEVILTLKKY